MIKRFHLKMHYNKHILAIYENFKKYVWFFAMEVKLPLLSIFLAKGSFSIGIFEKKKDIFHSSDKKYVARKKAGQR